MQRQRECIKGVPALSEQYFEYPKLYLFECSSFFFTSEEHLRSYHDEDQLVTVRTHVEFIVQPHGQPYDQHHELKSHSIALSTYWTNQSFPYPSNTERLAWKWNLWILKISIWLDQGSNPWYSASPNLAKQADRSKTPTFIFQRFSSQEYRLLPHRRPALAGAVLMWDGLSWSDRGLIWGSRLRISLHR